MSVIIIIKDTPIGQLILGKEITSIGRKSECDISLSDLTVSGNHAQIRKVGHHYLIQDLGSTNGIHIGGRKIKQYMLKNNDLISVGAHQLRFLTKEPSAIAHKEPSANPGPSVNLNKKPSGNLSEASSGRTRPGPKKEQAVGIQGYLLILSGEKTGARIELQGSVTTIGEPGIQLAAISRRPKGHFIIHVDGGKEKNKMPTVNGEPTGYSSLKLAEGDKIDVAGVEMEYNVTVNAAIANERDHN